MEIGWGGDTWDSRINLKYSQNLPILRADSMGGSPQARHEDRRRWIKDTFVAAIVAPFHARGKFHSCAKKQHRTQSNLTVHLDLWARCSWSFSRSSSTKGWHTAHIYFMKPRLISPPPSLLQIRLQFFFFSGKLQNNQAVQTELHKSEPPAGIRSNVFVLRCTQRSPHPIWHRETWDVEPPADHKQP